MAWIGSKHRVMPVVSSKRSYQSLQCVLRPFANRWSSECSWAIISFPWNMIICIETRIVIGNSFMIPRPLLAFRGGTLWFRCDDLWFFLWDLHLHLEERLCDSGVMTWRPVPTLFRWMNSLDLENLDHDRAVLCERWITCGPHPTWRDKLVPRQGFGWRLYRSICWTHGHCGVFGWQDHCHQVL